MGRSVDQDSIIGNFLPNVFIEKITLESSGHPNFHNLDDPHIKTEGNEDFARFRAENESISEADEMLKVTVDLVIKERAENTKDLVMSWLQQIDFQRFVKIQVMQSTDAAVTRVLAAGNSMLGLLTNPSWDNTNEFLSAYNLAFPSGGGPGPDIVKERFRSIQKRWIEFDDPRLQPLTRRGGAVQVENVWHDMDGNSYQDIPFTVTFLVDEVSPRHLAYVAAATLDVEGIIDEFNLRPDAPVAANGVASLDVVIDGGTATTPGVVVSDAYVTHDKDGKIWAGVTHIDDKGVLRSGHSGSPSSKPLTRRRISNDKIQDFRSFDRVKRYSVDTTPASNVLNSALTTREMKNFARDISPIKEASFWSPLALSKDDQEDVHYFFSIDMGKILKQKTQYGHLFAEGQLERAMTHVRILSMKVFRRRVSKLNILNKLGGPVSAEFVFDPNEPATLMAAVGETRPGDLKMAQGPFREVDIHPAIAGVRHFTGTDSSMKNVTYGHYRYEVELKILDETALFFQAKVRDLLRVRNTFKRYHNETLKTENYDPIRNKFKEHFGLLDNPTARTRYADLAEALAVYVISYDYIRKDGAPDRLPPSVRQQLVNMTSPRTGTPHSVGAVLELFDNLIDTYSNILDYSMGEAFATGADSEALALPAQRTQSYPRLPAVDLKHHFNEAWDSDIPKNYGYNYLALAPSPLAGINVMSGVSFVERAQVEAAQFFLRPADVPLVNGEVDLGVYSVEQNMFSFFSPAEVAIGNQTLSTTGANCLNTSVNNSILSGILAMRNAFNSPFNGGIIDLTARNVNSALSNAVTAGLRSDEANPFQDLGLSIESQSGAVMTTTTSVNRLVAADETSVLAHALTADCGPINTDPDLSAVTEESRLTSGERVEEGELQQAGAAAQATANVATGTTGIATEAQPSEEEIRESEISRFIGSMGQAANFDPALITSANLDLLNTMDQGADDLERGLLWDLRKDREREQEMENERIVQRRCATEGGFRYQETDGIPNHDYCALLSPRHRARYLAELGGD